jgi:hypothetical protein
MLTQVVGVWLTAVAVLTAALITLDPKITISVASLLLTLAVGPPAVLLLVWRGAPPPTVAEVLHAVNVEKRGRS